MKLSKSTITISEDSREKINTLKRKYKYSKQEEVLDDILDYFLEKELDPKDAKKPIHELVSESRNTLIAFQKTFESKKLNPMLFEIKQQFMTTNLTMQDFIKYSIEKDQHILEMIQEIKGSKKKSDYVIENKNNVIEEKTDNNNSNSLSNDKEELKILFDEFFKAKVGKSSSNGNVFEYDVPTFNKYMDKIRLIINKK